MAKIYIVFVGLLGIIGDVGEDGGKDGGAVLLRQARHRHSVGPADSVPPHAAYAIFRDAAGPQKVKLEDAVRIRIQHMAGSRVQIDPAILKMSEITDRPLAPEPDCMKDDDGDGNEALGSCKDSLAARFRELRGTARAVNILRAGDELLAGDMGFMKISRRHDLGRDQPAGTRRRILPNGILLEADIDSVPVLEIGATSYRLSAADHTDLARIDRTPSAGQSYVVWIENRPLVDLCTGRMKQVRDAHYALLYDFVYPEDGLWVPVIREVCKPLGYWGRRRLKLGMLRSPGAVAPGSQCITPELN